MQIYIIQTVEREKNPNKKKIKIQSVIQQHKPLKIPLKLTENQQWTLDQALIDSTGSSELQLIPSQSVPWRKIKAEGLLVAGVALAIAVTAQHFTGH